MSNLSRISYVHWLQKNIYSDNSWLNMQWSPQTGIQTCPQILLLCAFSLKTSNTTFFIHFCDAPTFYITVKIFKARHNQYINKATCIPVDASMPSIMPRMNNCFYSPIKPTHCGALDPVLFSFSSLFVLEMLFIELLNKDGNINIISSSLFYYIKIYSAFSANSRICYRNPGSA